MALQTKRVAIVGLGLMGGSLAAALKADHACREVVGIARRAVTTTLALERGLVDRATTKLNAVTQAGAIILAVPVRAIIEMLPQVGQLAKPGSLVMDLGSTKMQIVRAMEALPGHVQPVGGHPMCGKETSGLEAAEPDLYQGRTFVLTPLNRTGAQAFALAKELVEAVGARPLVLGAERHDRLVAAASHLPYLMACGLVMAAEDLAQGDGTLWQLAASGFRDATRLAASQVTLMADILLTNREAVIGALNTSQARLSNLANLLLSGDEEGLRSVLNACRERRRRAFP